jgi:catechol 2,3-dioxygenase-like lactoylglutathione lyase family enzyme
VTWVERQHPNHDELFLDHVGYFVPDLEKAREGLERLGFTLSPESTHYHPGPDGKLMLSGTKNRLVTFEVGYLEVLGAIGDAPLAEQLRAGLRRYAGLHLVAFTHADAERERARLLAAGFEPEPIFHLRRPVETQSGPATVRATVVRAKPGSMAEGRVQILTHGTPELIFVAERARHANHIDALTGLLVVVADPGEASDRYSRFTGRPGEIGDGLHRIALDRGSLIYTDPGRASRLLPGLEAPDLPFSAAVLLRSPDLQRTRAALLQRGIKLVLDRADCLMVGPADGLGGFMVIHGPGQGAVWP